MSEQVKDLQRRVALLESKGDLAAVTAERDRLAEQVDDLKTEMDTLRADLIEALDERRRAEQDCSMLSDEVYYWRCQVGRHDQTADLGEEGDDE
jgi:cell division protein FtsB